MPSGALPPPTSSTPADPHGPARPSASPLDAGADVPPLAVADTPSPPVRREPAHPFGARPVPEGAIAASSHDTLLGAWNQGGNGDATARANRAGFHPATRVILDTRVLSGKRSLGRLSPAGVLAQTRNLGYWPFRLCLEDGIRAGTDVRGKAVFRFSIDPRGRVSYVRRMRSEFSASVTDCMRKATYGPRYAPAPPRRADVELVAEVSAGDVPLPPRDPAAPPFDERPISAPLDALTQRVAECYGQGLQRDSALWGRIALRLQLSAEGAVRDASELHSRFLDPDVTACTRAAALQLNLPEASTRDLVVAFRLGEWTPP